MVSQRLSAAIPGSDLQLSLSALAPLTLLPKVAAMIDLTKYYYFLFGVLTIVGGVMGYVKAGSMASIIAGGIAGLLLIGAGVLFATHTQPGIILGLIISIALAGRFIPAFLKEYSVMPAGMMSVLSVIGVILGVLSLIFYKR